MITITRVPSAEGLCCSPSLWCLGVLHPWGSEVAEAAWSEQLNSSRGDEQHGRFGEGQWTSCPSLPLKPSAGFVTALRGCLLTLGVTFGGHC